MTIRQSGLWFRNRPKPNKKPRRPKPRTALKTISVFRNRTVTRTISSVKPRTKSSIRRPEPRRTLVHQTTIIQSKTSKRTSVKPRTKSLIRRPEPRRTHQTTIIQSKTSERTRTRTKSLIGRPEPRRTHQTTIIQSKTSKRPLVRHAREKIPMEFIGNHEIQGMAHSFGHFVPRTAIPSASSGETWPENLPTVVITIHQGRKIACLFRLKDVPKHALHVLEGSRGTTTLQIGNRGLKRGQLGCYDSHYRALSMLVQHPQWTRLLVLEDDVALTTKHFGYLNMLVSEFKQSKSQLCFLSWFRTTRNMGPSVSAHLKPQWTFCQLWGYLVTKQGAEILLKQLKTIYEPIDVALFHKRDSVSSLVAYPPLCLTVGSHSDTENLR